MAVILTKKKDTTGAPVAGDLTNSSGGAELAVNTADKRLYTKDSGGNVVEVGTNPGTAVTFTAGTVSAPAITTTGDTNTGVFFPAADTIAFAEGGAEAMRINSDSQVVTTAGTASLPAITTTGDVNTGIFFPAADTIAFAEGGAEAMRIDSSGNVGIGTNSPNTKLDVAGTTRLSNTTGNKVVYIGQSTPSSNDGASLEFQNSSTQKNWAIRSNFNASGTLEFCPSSAAGGTTYTTPSMVIDSSGNVLVGITSARANAGDVQVSKGISFPATQSAQSDANTLDDYEEGTFTPTLFGASTTGTTTYAQQEGYYTKIGRQVTVSILLAATAMTGTGNLRIGNLPFAVGVSAWTSSVMVDSYNWSAGTYLVSYISSTETSMRIFGIADDAAWTAQNVVNETQTWYLTLTYFV